MDPYRITSIVLFTDGGSKTGRDLAQFTDFYRALPAAAASVPVYPVVFGSGNTQMSQLAQLTGGSVFDGATQSMSSVFAQIG